MHGAAVARRGVCVWILRRHRDGEADPGRGRGGGGRQYQLAGGRGIDGQVGRGGERVRRIGRGQRLRAGFDQRRRETALAVRQGGVGRQHHTGRGVGRAEAHGAGITCGGVAVGVLGDEREGEAGPGRGGGGGGGHGQRAGRGGVHRQVGRHAEPVDGIGGGQRLRPGPDQGR